MKGEEKCHCEEGALPDEAISCYEEIAHRTGVRRECRAKNKRALAMT